MLEIITVEKNPTNWEYYWKSHTEYKKEWEEVLKNSPKYEAVDFYRRNRKPDGFYMVLVGEAKTIEEKLVKAFYDENSLTYISATDKFPEDFVESRTSWEDMQNYADEMKWFIYDLLDTI